MISLSFHSHRAVKTFLQIVVLLAMGASWATSPTPAPATPAPSPTVAASPTAPAHSYESNIHKVAILPFTGDDDLSPGLINSTTKRFQNDLDGTGTYEIAKRRKVNKFLASRDPESGPCQPVACFQELGRQLGVQGIFTGHVSRGSETWRLQVKLYDVETGETTFGHLVEAFGTSEGLLKDDSREMAKIAGGIKIPESNYTVLDRSAPFVWPWVAGGLLVAAGGATAAVLLMDENGGGATPPAPTPNSDQLIVKW